MVITKKKRYEFWNYRDTRKEKFRPIKPVSLPITSSAKKVIKGFISNNILLPLDELPQVLINKLQADLTLRNPQFEKARKYGKGFVPFSVPEFVKLYSVDKQFIALPRSVKRGYLNKQFEQCGLKLCLNDMRPKFEKINFKQKGTIKPLFYQKEAIAKIIGGNCIIQFSCGRGKTFLTLLAIGEVKYKTLILVRTNIILRQWIDAIKEVFDINEADVGIINGENETHGLITVATEQSLVTKSREEKRTIGEMYGHIVVDECHESAAIQYRDLLTYFKAKKMTGLSATPIREDGLTGVIKAYIGQIIQIDDLGEIPTYIDISNTDFAFAFDSVRVKTQYNQLLDALIIDVQRNLAILEKIIKYTEEGHYVLVYSKRIKHLEILKEQFEQLKPNVVTDILVSEYKGKNVSDEEQYQAKEKFRNGETRVLFGGTIIEQGFNVERASVVVLATPVKSGRLIKQLLGRVQREYPGKDCAYVVDFVDRNVKILLYQFFCRNRKIYSSYVKKGL